MLKTINEFQGEFRFLSNFYPSIIHWKGIEFPTVEHAYQYEKVLKTSDKNSIHEANSPGEAKHIGNHVEIVDNWEEIKIAVMYNLVHRKFFNHQTLAYRLIETDNSILIEGNRWGDQFWGQSFTIDGLRGQNWLGRILMLVRSELYLMGY